MGVSAAAMSRRGSADAKEGSAKNHKRTGSKELQTENSFERTYSLSVEDPTAGNIFKRSYSALSANTTPTLATDEIDEEIPPVKLVPPVRVVMPREEPLSRPNSESILMDSGTVAARIRENRQQEVLQRNRPYGDAGTGSLNTMEMGEEPAGEDESFLDVRMVRSRYGTGAYGFYILVYGVAAFIVLLLMIMGVIITNGIHVMSKYMAETCAIEMSELHLSTLQKSCDDLNWLSGLNTAIIIVMTIAMGLVLCLLAATIYITRSQGMPYHKYMSKEL